MDKTIVCTQTDTYYNCFCDVFASNGSGIAYVYHDGNKCDVYVEGRLETSSVISKEIYDKEFDDFVKRSL